MKLCQDTTNTIIIKQIQDIYIKCHINFVYLQSRYL